VTQLRKKVLEELERRNYSQATAHAYVGAIRRFAKHFHRSPDQLGCEHVREYQLHLVQERKLHPRSVMIQMAALRFLFLKVLKRRFCRDDLPLPKLLRRQVPVVLSPEEVARLIDSAANLRHRSILMTLYSTGMRRSELCHLRPEDEGQPYRQTRHIGRRRELAPMGVPPEYPQFPRCLSGLPRDLRPNVPQLGRYPARRHFARNRLTFR
jgi:site-specific recombinase XerD